MSRGDIKGLKNMRGGRHNMHKMGKKGVGRPFMDLRTKKAKL